MAAPAALERIRYSTAQQFRNYRIMPAGQGFALWKWTGQHGWELRRHFPSREAAENALFVRLPPPIA